MTAEISSQAKAVEVVATTSKHVPRVLKLSPLEFQHEKRAWKKPVNFLLHLFFGSALKSLQHRVDDDFVDQLNYKYTSMILFAFAILVSAKTYGEPIQCWVPAQFTDAWEQYTENYCWAQNTYYLPMFDPIPAEYRGRQARQIGYYQWVPLMLALEAIMFWVPCAIWRGLLHWNSAGMNVHGLVEMAVDAKMFERRDQLQQVHTIAGHIEDALEVKRQATITALYILIKVFYALNAFGQLVLLTTFLGAKSVFYGFDVLEALLAGHEWQETGNFPRVTMCDFEVRVLGNIHHYTVQCVLILNLLNEKICLILWFWFLIVGMITATSLLHWIFITAFPSQRERFLKKYLIRVVADRQATKKFVFKTLGHDGIFCLRMVAAHAGDNMATALACALWNRYNQHSKKTKTSSGVDALVETGATWQGKG